MLTHLLPEFKIDRDDRRCIRCEVCVRQCGFDVHEYSEDEDEVYADDVKCSHGSTTGQLEEDALFYLRSRGISEETATSMLLFGFVSEVIERIKIEPLKEFLTSNLITR